VDKIYKSSVFLLWTAIVVIYPMLISIYVALPLFVGFSGLMLIIGIDEERYLYILFSLIYMINLEVNLSLPIFLLPISVTIFYMFLKEKLNFLKLCVSCVSITSVILIDLIYFSLLFFYDFVTGQSSINYDSFLLFSVIYDIIAAVLV